MRKTLILSITMVLGLASSNIFSQKELQVAAKQFELGIYHESLKTIQDIEKTQPLDARGLVIKGQSQNQLGDYYGAVASFNKARSISPTDYSFALAYANSLIRTGQYEASKAELSYLKNDQVVNHMMDYCDFGLNNISMKSSDQLAVQSRVANFGAIKINGEIYYNTFGTPLMDPVAQQTITGQMGFHLVKDDGKSGIGILKGIHNKMNIGNLSM
ncbi:MAG TPA: hypothetical protein PKD85_12705, partial [Saprospiraceae bacterium]|nr:hypothetical protein [Saprospiraceae bacterium]